ncbi:MAG TPA: hypothetical protein VK550_09965 [Polyangiaceae bacterium]|nr:hypothetical protein [Polyangiaceae bacterium]
MKTTHKRNVTGPRAIARCMTPPLAVAALFGWCSCGGSAPQPKSGREPPSTAVSSGAPASSPAATGPSLPTSELADNAAVAFRADFSLPELGQPWNVFGAQNANRQVKGGPDGLWVKIAQAEKAWDAVGARTAKIKIDGDFDLRGRFRDFSARGNGSAKLIIVDAATTKGEAAYVERIQIDGKNLFKFGGDVGGSLENWGFAPTDVDRGDLRLVRQGNTLHAYTRPDERSSWTEFAPAQPAPKTMPRVVKFGIKLSSETNLSAQVRWIDLTMNGQLIRTE